MITTGARVVTLMGDELGTVKEVRDGCFKVNAPAQPDYWLGTDAVLEDGERTVRLRVTGDRIDELKRDAPQPDADAGRPASDLVL